MPLVNKAFGDIITFTRASAATRINALGVLESVAANVPRIDYDPVTLAVRGLLVEEQRTNLVPRSEGLNQVPWTLSGATVSDSFASPNGTLTAQKLVESAANVEHFASIPTTYSSGSVLAVSVFAKKAERSQIDFSTDGTPFGGVVQRIRFDLDAETATSVSGSSVGKLTKYKDGWFRCEAVMPATTTSGTNAFARVRLNSAGQALYAGDGTSGLLLWGAQVEVGGFVTSYIPTSGSQVTRAGDVAQINTLSPWYNAAAGTLFCEFTPMADSTLYHRILDLNDGTTNNSVRSFRGGGGITQMASTASGVSDVSFLGGGNTATGVVSKKAMALEKNNMAICLNGAAPSVDNSCEMPSVTNLRLGHTSGTPGSFLNGYFRKVRYYPKRLTNAELQALTA